MKRTIYIAVALMLILRLDATAIAQNKQDTSVDPCTMFGTGCVQTSYDKFEERTYVFLTTVGIYRDRRSGFYSLSMSVGYSSPGTKIVRPEFAVFYFDSTANLSDEVNALEDNQHIYLLIDDTPHDLGNASFRKFDNTHARRWTYALAVPFQVLELIASGKSVEMRAGPLEMTLDNNLKTAFRRLVELAPKEVVAPKKEDAAPVKPPTPKRTQRSRRGRP